MILTFDQAKFCARMIKNAVENDVCWLRMEIGRDDNSKRQISFDYAFDTLIKVATIRIETYNPFTDKKFVSEKESHKSVKQFNEAYNLVPKKFVNESKVAFEAQQLKAAKIAKKAGKPLFSSEKRLIEHEEKLRNKKLIKSEAAKVTKRSATERTAYEKKKDKGLAIAKAAHQQTMQTLRNLRNKKKVNQQSDELGFN